MPANTHISKRLQGALDQLIAVHVAGDSMSSASRGGERAEFGNKFLSDVLPQPYRFGKGDATDSYDNRSGQLDVVVEFPFLPSLPLPGSPTSRLYLAEGIVAVLEIKSDLSAQWDEVVATATKLAALKRRDFTAMYTGKMPPPERIPFFAVGYCGWKTIETVRQHLDREKIDGILVIEPPSIFVGTNEGDQVAYKGTDSLWGLVSCLTQLAQKVSAGSFNPACYAADSSTS